MNAPSKSLRGRPPGSKKVLGEKTQVSIRLDKGLIAGLRETGPGWQSRLNSTLVKLSVYNQLTLTNEALREFRRMHETNRDLSLQNKSSDDLISRLLVLLEKQDGEYAELMAKYRIASQKPSVGKGPEQITTQLKVDLDRCIDQLSKGNFLGSQHPGTIAAIATAAIGLRRLADELSQPNRGQRKPGNKVASSCGG